MASVVAAPGRVGSGPAPGEVEFHPADDVPTGLRDAWEQARLRSDYPRGTDRIDWLVHASRYNGDVTPALVVLRDSDGRFVGGLPVWDQVHRIRWRLRLPHRAITVARFSMPVTRVLSEEVIGSDDEQVAAQLLAAICDARRDHGMVVVNQSRLGTGLSTALARLGRRPRAGWLRAPLPIDTVRLQGAFGDDFDDYLRGRVRASDRSKLRQHQRRNLEAPGGRLTLVEHPDQVDQFVDAIARVIEGSWHGRQGAVVTTGRRAHDLRWLAERGELLGCVFEDDSGPVAFELSRLIDGTQWMDASAYRADRRKHSPGEMVVHTALRAGHERGARLVDWGYGQQPYKLRWSNSAITTRRTTFVRTKPGSLVAAWPPLAYRWARGLAVRRIDKRGLTERLRAISNERLKR